jgi:hypothetical protein
MTLRTTRFIGPLNAQMVAITAAQAGQTASLGPIAWGVDPGAGGGGDPMPPNATLSIVVEPMDAQAIAPHPQWFDVADLVGFTPSAPGPGQTFNPQAHDITYIWDFGDPGSVPHPSCNLPTAWRDTNVAYGKRVCHVFDGAGTYTVTLWAFDQNGHYGTATASVTVANPDNAFPGNRTICVNPAGDPVFTGAPAGAQQVQGLAAVEGAIGGLGGQTARVLLKRGATFNGAIPWPNGTPNRYVNAYGTGADPIITHTGVDGDIIGTPQAPSLYNKFVNIDYRGDWNPDTEIGRYTNFSGLGRGFFLLHKCRFSGFIEFAPGSDPIGTITFSACLLERWRDYGSIIATPTTDHRVAYIGTAVHQSSNALVGQPESFNGSKVGNLGSPVRAPHMVASFWSCSSFFSNVGWSQNGNIGTIPRTQTHINAVQGALRMNGGGLASFTGQIINTMDRVVCEGGAGILAVAAINETTNWIADKVIILCNSYAGFGRPVEITGGCTLRNFFIFWPNTPAGQSLPAGVINNSASTTNGANARRVAIYGLTFYSPITGANKANAGGSTSFDLWEPNGQTPFSNLIAENNVVHLPAQGVPQVASAPVQLVAIPGLTTLFRGPRWNFPLVEVSLASDVPNGGTVTFPYPNDTALHPNGRATNQDYFLTPPGQNQHILGITGNVFPNAGKPLRSWAGEFSVSFGASNITVTNTSGIVWPSGRTLALQLDRRNDLVPPLAQYASPESVEVPVPIAGSPALGGAITGLIPIDDLLGGRRPGQMRNNGSVVSGSASRGARDPVAA